MSDSAPPQRGPLPPPQTLPPPAPAPMTPLGPSAMRASNMGLVLRHLQLHGARSRSRIAAETGLSKASLSSIVQELGERGLVREERTGSTGRVGRPGTDIALAPHRAAGIGMEISGDYTSVVVLDLAGEVLHSDTEPLAVDPGDPHVPVQQIVAQLGTALSTVSRLGMWNAGITVAPPGVIDDSSGTVRFAANLNWVNFPLREVLREQMGPGLPAVGLENDAKLSALASYPEHAARGVRDLVFLTGDMGVGAGIIAHGELVRGWSGFSGEVGHMPLEPEGLACRCGRSGCWETRVGFGALLDSITPDPSTHDESRPMLSRLDAIRDRLDAGDRAAEAALDDICRHLIRGAGVLTDVLNPKLLVLGGYFGYFADRFQQPLVRALEERALDRGGHVEVVPARLGMYAAATGGALRSLESVLTDPTTVPMLAQSSAHGSS